MLMTHHACSCAGEAPRLVAVPTHFYKVILAETDAKSGGGLLPSKASLSGSTRVVGAFVMPNQAIDPTTPLAAFAVPITALEEASGGSCGKLSVAVCCTASRWL